MSGETGPIQQIEIVQRQSRLRTLAIVGLAGAVAFTGVAIKSCGEGETRVDATTEMEHLEASRAQPFIEYGGRTSAIATDSLHVWKWISKIGGKEIPLTKSSSSAQVGGVAEFRTDRNAFTSWVNHEDGSTDVEVDANKIYIQYSMAVQMKDGKPVSDSKMEPFAITTGDGILKRGFIAEEAARRVFVYRCGKVAVNTLSTGVKLFVHDIKKLVQEGHTSAPNSQVPGGVTDEEIEAFKKINVTFTQSAPGPGGTVYKRKVDPADIDIKLRDMTQWPPKVVPLKREDISLHNLEEKNKIKITPGGKCEMNAGSMRAYARLTGKRSTPKV
jgi:hypothetical protein